MEVASQVSGARWGLLREPRSHTFITQDLFWLLEGRGRGLMSSPTGAPRACKGYLMASGGAGGCLALERSL